jgi:replication initiation protein RepC
MHHAHHPGRGLRRYDERTVIASKLTDTFRGLDKMVSPSNALSALKRAAPYMAIPLRVVALVDLLFAWTKPQDWQGGDSLPVVWPSNELLGQKLGVGVRQVQKLLNQAQALGLVSFLDSPNGHRGGRRSDGGKIVWGYGIVLAPVGTRYAEFLERAARGIAEDQVITVLRKRLASARRKIRGMAQTLLDGGHVEPKADETLALALMATDQMRGVRDTGLLTSCVRQIEDAASVLAERLQVVLTPNCEASRDVGSSWSDALPDAHSTTTNHLQSAKADTSRGLARESSKPVGVGPDADTAVHADLDKHGVTPGFMIDVAPDLCHELLGHDRSWGELTAVAERAANQSGISQSAFREAIRVMGSRGATASVFATVQKYRTGEVRRPGAYLRGMTAKAMTGDLNLGRTLHGLKDSSRLTAMKGLADESGATAIGTLISGLMDRTARA